MKGRAGYHSYPTHSHTDSGPADYQVSKRAEAHAQEIIDAATKITAGMQFAAQQVPVLHAMASEYIAVTMDGKPGDPDKIRRDMMSLARQEYQSNYEKGLDVEPFKWAIVFLFAGIGLLTGGLMGKGTKMILDNFRDEGMTVGDFIKHPAWKSIRGAFTGSAGRSSYSDSPAPSRHKPGSLNL
jgi:hypothetical protein